jgi:hypothetical protein
MNSLEYVSAFFKWGLLARDGFKPLFLYIFSLLVLKISLLFSLSQANLKHFSFRENGVSPALSESPDHQRTS